MAESPKENGDRILNVNEVGLKEAIIDIQLDKVSTEQKCNGDSDRYLAPLLVLDGLHEIVLSLKKLLVC